VADDSDMEADASQITPGLESSLFEEDIL
jgi:hypothetical protein